MPRLSAELYADLSAWTDDTTMVLSTGFDRQPSYQMMQRFGIENLPYLIDDLSRSHSWWRAQMICELAATSLGQCIYFDPDTLGTSDATRSRVLAWWKQSGCAAYSEQIL